PPAAHRGHAAVRLRRRPGHQPVRPPRPPPRRPGRRYRGRARAPARFRHAGAGGARARGGAAAACGRTGGDRRLRRTRAVPGTGAPGRTGRPAAAADRRRWHGGRAAPVWHRQRTAGAAMRQEQFVARHQAEWQELELWLHHRARARGAPRPGAPATVPDGEIPARYRRLCQQLALARRGGYSAPLLERLQRLMQEGHAVLYRAPPPRWRMAAQFVAGGFPRLVRSKATVMWASLALFALPLVVAGLLVLWRPELAHNVMGPEQLAQLERMYDSGDPARALGRDSGTDWRMFGHYVMNNGSIGLRMFAGRLLAGVGTVFVLVFNGLAIGTAAGYLQAVGHGGPFWRFVCTHAALELTALVIAGGAGLRLGMAL